MAKRETSGQITELERGRKYSIRVRLAPDETHDKWHWSKSRKVEGNKAEATAALVAYRKELENPEDDTSLPLKEYAKTFQENRRALGKVSDLTLERDKIDIKRITKYLGEAEITELDVPTIEKAYVEMSNDGASKDAIHKTHMKLKQIMRKAFNEGLIVRNPCDAVDGITRPKQDPDKKKERRFTKEEAIRFAKTLKENKKTGKIVATWLALTTGMRRGEVLALTWGDIDLENKRIHVRKQFGKEKTRKEPKTSKSKRVVSIDDETFALLTQWKDDQAQEFNKADLKQSDNSPVCSNELCNFIDPDNFSRWRREFYVANGFAHYAKEEKWIDSRGIERIKRTGYIGPNFHALRHAQATLLVAGGVDPKTVQARLGHEKISTTLEIYAEAVEENDRAAADMMGALLSGQNTDGEQ